MAESFLVACAGPKSARTTTSRAVSGAYAAEMDWREDRRRFSNGEQFAAIVTAAAKHPVSRRWKGYWQRRAA